MSQNGSLFLFLSLMVLGALVTSYAKSANDGFDPNANNSVSSIVVQADGKILVGGDFTTIGGVARNRIARLNPDGSPDAGFNPNPNANGYPYAYNASVSSIVVQADGKILVGGLFSNIGGWTRNSIARLNPDGSLDAGFPDVFGSPFVNNASVSSIVVQADGKILVGGSLLNVNGSSRIYIARLNPDGSPDWGFNPNANGNGSPFSLDSVSSIAVQADGKTLVGGLFRNIGGWTRNYIARLNRDGRLDIGFNPIVNGSSYPIASVSSIVVQADGKILVGGKFTTIAGVARNSIARLNPDGSLDAGFNPNANGSPYPIASVSSIVVQADGKILVGGDFSTIAGVARNSIARLNPDGSLDAGFNHNANGRVCSIAVQADAKILVGGDFTTIGGVARNRIARLFTN